MICDNCDGLGWVYLYDVFSVKWFDESFEETGYEVEKFLELSYNEEDWPQERRQLVTFCDVCDGEGTVLDDEMPEERRANDPR